MKAYRKIIKILETNNMNFDTFQMNVKKTQITQKHVLSTVLIIRHYAKTALNSIFSKSHEP